MRTLGFVCIGILIAVSFAHADTITINSLSSTTSATISFNNGSVSQSEKFPLAQINVTYAGSAGTFTFNTFSIDLLHNPMAGQSYNVAVRTNLAPAFTNASQIAYVFQQFGLFGSIR